MTHTLSTSTKLMLGVKGLCALIVVFMIGSLISQAQPLIPLPGDTPHSLDVRATELLVNGGFEFDANVDGLPDEWIGKNTTTPSADKRKCDKIDKPIAHSGLCAFQFRGNANGTTSGITQDVEDTSALVNGAIVTFSAYIDPRSAPPDTVFGKALVKYSDGSKQKFTLAVPSPDERGVEDYVLESDTEIIAIPEDETIVDVKIKLSYITKAGKYLLDDVSFAVGTLDPTATPTTQIEVTNTDTPVSTATHTATATLIPSSTPTNTDTPIPTNGPSATFTASRTPTVTSTATTTSVPTGMASATTTASPTSTIIPTKTATNTPTKTISPTPTKTSTPQPSSTFTNTPITPTTTITFTPSATSSPTSTPIPQIKIVASDGVSGDFFGSAVAISADGTFALVGAPEDTVGAELEQGSVYFYTRSGDVWTQQGQILAAEDQATTDFGISIAISNDGLTAAIGAPGYSITQGAVIADAGAVYIFTRNGNVWTEQQRLQASDAAFASAFGYSVALSNNGNVVLVGAYKHDVSGNDEQGQAYIFTRNGTVWTEQHKLTGSESEAGDRFGGAVAMNSDATTLLVTGYFQDILGELNQGAAYIFTFDGTTYTEQQMLVASDGNQSDEFGWSAALNANGNTAIIGSPDHDNDGAAYVFTRNGGVWTQQQKLQEITPVGDFGSSVVLSSDGNTALVGAPDADVNSLERVGKVFLYTRSGNLWTFVQSYIADDEAAEENFGYSVDMNTNGTYALVGAAGDALDRGAAYAFPIP